MNRRWGVPSTEWIFSLSVILGKENGVLGKKGLDLRWGWGFFLLSQPWVLSSEDMLKGFPAMGMNWPMVPGDRLSTSSLQRLYLGPRHPKSSLIKQQPLKYLLVVPPLCYTFNQVLPKIVAYSKLCYGKFRKEPVPVLGWSGNREGRVG